MFARKEVKKMQSIYRTITADKLTESLIGAHVTMCGWVENIRDHGGVSFIDLRDFYGVVQVVMREKSLLDGIGREDCISVTGPIEARDEETYNPKIPTGTIELGCKSVRILGKVKRPLPFEVLTSKETREDIRLKYRFLDMRNRKVKENIVFRAKVISFLRSQMEQMGFLEVQTPILCASSPEGARDYIVPSRRYKGKFYALPQAPQQYKQLLMVGGIDRYFQIAPCFRDEDARADRSPGEFYQLDFEMAFATQEDVFSVGEKVLYETFKKFAPQAKITSLPFPVIPYAQAMLEFGTDKPDLRNPLVKAFAIAGYTEEELKTKFGALYTAFQFGAPPHAGMAPGIDRMLMLLCGEESIREVVAFPMSSSGQDLLCGAPCEVTEAQLRETHIKIRN